VKIVSKSANETLKIGRKIAVGLKQGDIICLFGELGSGKTTLAKGIAEGLGINGQEVTSPSFVLVRQHYKGRLPFFHLDLYRLKLPCDALGLGYEECVFADAVAVVEWADRLKYLLPKEFLKIELSVMPGSKRRLMFTARGARYEELLKKSMSPVRNKI
jgi:tRNA threonylcarbamoyladenosine biosynthesis protein TsaE